MNATTETKPLTPEARQRRPVTLGSPVRFGDGQEWRVPAMPVGPAGDPIADALDRIEALDARLQVVEARQRGAFQRSLSDVVGGSDEDEAMAIYVEHQARVREVEGMIRREQVEVVYLSLRLLYDIEREEVTDGLLLDQKAFRKVHEIISGVPQVDEIQEAIAAMGKGGGSGN